MAVIKPVYSCCFCIMYLGDCVCAGVNTVLDGHLDSPGFFLASRMMNLLTILSINTHYSLGKYKNVLKKIQNRNCHRQESKNETVGENIAFCRPTAPAQNKSCNNDISAAVVNARLAVIGQACLGR